MIKFNAAESVIISDKERFANLSYVDGQTVSCRVTKFDYSSVGWRCRIHQLHLCRRVRSHPYECPVYDIEQFHGEGPGLEIWGMGIASSLPLLLVPLWPEW